MEFDKKSNRGGVRASASSTKKEPSEHADNNAAAAISKKDGHNEENDDFKVDNGGRNACSNNASINAHPCTLVTKKSGRIIAKRALLHSTTPLLHRQASLIQTKYLDTNQVSHLGKNSGQDKTGGIISNAIACRSEPLLTSECTTNHPSSRIDEGRFQTQGADPLIDIGHQFGNMTAASKQMKEMAAVAWETITDYEARLLQMRQQQEARQLQQQCLAGEKAKSQLKECKLEDERLESKLRELLQNQKLQNKHLKEQLCQQRETNVVRDAMMNEAKTNVGYLRAKLEKQKEVNGEKDVFVVKTKGTLRSLL